MARGILRGLSMMLATLLLGGVDALAAPAHGLDGSQLSLAWSIPFAGLLLSIAVLPLVWPHFWERHFGKVGLFWALAFLAPGVWLLGPRATAAGLLHAVAVEYLPFMILLFALFVVSGGILIVGNLRGTPATNTLLLAVGTAIANVLGTTGASMLLIRTVIRANAERRHKVHVFVFFIFLVANIGGSLTPLGDPPLFLGFLLGVDFLWTTSTMFQPMMVMATLLLALFYLLDRRAWRREVVAKDVRPATLALRVEGRQNIVYLAAVLAAVLMSGFWNSGIAIPLGGGVERRLEGVSRDAVLLVIAYLSWRTTSVRIRLENAFRWTPIQEVAVLFAAIFVTIIPVMAILAAGSNGALAALIAFVSTPDGKPVDSAYFWLTGLLSGFLDNAPTYLVFFNLAGGDPKQLMGPLASTLLAISAGAVFMGALTYIGNAPNFMVKKICDEHGVRMPGFFGYMLWSGAILLPLFVLLTFLFF